MVTCLSLMVYDVALAFIFTCCPAKERNATTINKRKLYFDYCYYYTGRYVIRALHHTSGTRESSSTEKLTIEYPRIF